MNLWAASALAALGCASPSLRGATSIDRDSEPDVPSAVRLAASDCRDARGYPVPGVALDYVYSQDSSGFHRLLERRAEHDSVLIRNSYEEQGARVFVYVSSDTKHPDVLHRVRLTRGLSGELTLSRSFAIEEAAHGFRAAPKRIVLRCSLGPLQADADAAHGDTGG